VGRYLFHYFPDEKSFFLREIPISIQEMRNYCYRIPANHKKVHLNGPFYQAFKPNFGIYLLLGIHGQYFFAIRDVVLHQIAGLLDHPIKQLLPLGGEIAGRERI
jgi:hypothetical protein